MFDYEDFILYLREVGDTCVGDPINPTYNPITEWIEERYGVESFTDGAVIWYMNALATTADSFDFAMQGMNPEPVLKLLAQGAGACLADDHNSSCCCEHLTGERCLSILGEAL